MRGKLTSIEIQKKLDKAKNICCSFWGVDIDIVFTKTRDSNIMNARHSIRYMLGLDGNLNLTQIGELTNCTHASVIHSNSTFCNLADTEVDYAAMNRVILVAEINSKKDILKESISNIILSKMLPEEQVDLIYSLTKSRGTL